MFKKIPLLSILCLLAMLVACTQTHVRLQKSKHAFENYSAYAWYENRGKTKVGLSSQVFQPMIQTIEQVLKTKGYSKTRDDSVNFFINYQVAKQDIVEAKQAFAYSGFSPDFQWFDARGALALDGDLATARLPVSAVPRGAVLIDVIDAKTDRLIWRGSIDKAASKGMTQEQRDVSMKRAIVDGLKWLPGRR